MSNALIFHYLMRLLKGAMKLLSFYSNPVPDFDLNSQLDHIDDPEEYYFAFEQLESNPLPTFKVNLSSNYYLLVVHPPPHFFLWV